MIVPDPFKRFDGFKPGQGANKAAVGNRVYNGTSPSPQAGKGSVNPQGYSERDARAKAKKRLLQQRARRVM